MSKKSLVNDNPLVVFGSFGFGNIGDEAVPFAIQDLLEDIGVERMVRAVSRYNHPKLPNILGLGKEYQPALASLSGAPAILVGGGIIEPRNMCCALRFLNYMELAKPAKSSIYMGSFEFGVNYGMLIKRRLNKLFKGLDNIYLRDYLSDIYLRDTFPRVKASSGGDVVLGMRPSTERALSSQLQNNKYIAVCLCGVWKDDKNWYQWIISELVDLSDCLDKPLLFVPMSCHPSDDDRVEHQLVADGILACGINNKPLILNKILAPREFAAVVRDAALVVSMRLHGCVLSYAQQTPFVGLSYHPKLVGFAQTVGWRNFILPTNHPIKQSSGQYGYQFSALGFEKNELYKTASAAMDHGSFNLLPVLLKNLRNELEYTL